MRLRTADPIPERVGPLSELSPTDRAQRSAYIGFGVVIVLAGIFVVYCARRLWFGGDEWFIITDRGLTSGPGHLGLFQPHFEHWTTLPILAFRGLYWAFGLRTYWPYILLPIVAHFAVVVLLWRVMLRSGVDAWVATCASAVFAVTGTGFENLLNAFQVTLIASVAFGLAAMLVIPETGAKFVRRDALAVALLTAGLMCSGVGLPMLVAVGLVQLVRRGWRVAAVTVVLPAALYVWWYLAYGRQGARVATAAPDAIPDFVWHGLTGALGDVARVELIGTAVVLAVVTWLGYRLFRRGYDSSLTLPVALAIGGVAFLAATGYRRGNLFGSNPAESRYAYVTLALVIPLVAQAAQTLFRPGRARRVLLAAVTVALVIAQARELDHQANLARPGKRSDRGALLATASLVRQGRTFLLSRPLSAFEPQVTVDEIAAMDRAGKLPPLDQATKRDFLTVLARLDLVVAPDPAVPPAGVARVDSTRRATTTPDGAGCVRVRARPDNELVVRLDGPTSFRIRGQGLLGAHLRDATQAVDGETVYFLLTRGRPQVLSASTAEALLVLTLPTDSPSVLCDVVG
jgi:hypothetical protein